MVPGRAGGGGGGAHAAGRIAGLSLIPPLNVCSLGGGFRVRFKPWVFKQIFSQLATERAETVPAGYASSGQASSGRRLYPSVLDIELKILGTGSSHGQTASHLCKSAAHCCSSTPGPGRSTLHGRSTLRAAASSPLVLPSPLTVPLPPLAVSSPLSSRSSPAGRSQGATCLADARGWQREGPRILSAIVLNLLAVLFRSVWRLAAMLTQLVLGSRAGNSYHARGLRSSRFGLSAALFPRFSLAWVGPMKMSVLSGTGCFCRPQRFEIKFNHENLLWLHHVILSVLSSSSQREISSSGRWSQIPDIQCNASVEKRS